MFELHQKWWLFLQLAAEKKTPFLVQLKQIVDPSCFVRALAAFFPYPGFQWKWILGIFVQATRKTRREKIVEQILEKSITVQNTAHVNATYHNGRF